MTAPDSVDLGPVDVHVWLTWTDSVDPTDSARCLVLLSADERARHDRFHFDRDRHVYRVAHALLRTTLSRYAPIAPSDWRFVTTSHGRPELVPGTCKVPLRFNISHTRGLVACAVTLEREVGVDVEAADRADDPLDSMEPYFAPREIASLRRLPSAAAQRARFFTLWTLKEAYIKARGLGLEIPLHQFAFDIPPDPESPAAVAFTPPLVDDPMSWYFARLQPAEDHFLACAARCAPGDVVALRVTTIAPLQ
ncbi:MAG TPA: 4'-phosphopantetheinyl transferase superfamily protein [Kofleriaceae bacterium]|nr:4'-phosphopantetheinyl transferase superfamily protein [Kofleriaceae bacterium]